MGKKASITINSDVKDLLIKKLANSRKGNSWINSIDRDLVIDAINSIKELSKSNGISLDCIPLSALIIVIRDSLRLSTNSIYNQMKEFKNRIEELGFTLIKHGKGFAIDLEDLN